MELTTSRRLIDKDALIADYKKKHKGPPGKAFELIEAANELEVEMGIVEFLQIKDEFCSQHKCFECPAHTYCGNVHEEALHAEDLVRAVKEWLDAPKQPEDAPLDKTYLEVFYEHYPNARKNPDGTPYSVCRRALMGNDQDYHCDGEQDCLSCWQEKIN